MGISTFKLPRPRHMSEKQRGALVESCLLRVQSRGHEHALTHKSSVIEYLGQRGKPTPDMWILLLIRMITRGSWSSADVEDENEEEETSGDSEGNEVAKPNGLNAKLDGEYRMRKMLFNYIITDFASRYFIDQIP
jgi:symplekin